MITQYTSGVEFLVANGEFLKTNGYLSAFFFLDAPLLKNSDKRNYAFRSERDGKTLLLLKVEPYDALFFGDKECVPELLGHIWKEKLEFEAYLSGTDVGESLRLRMASFGIVFQEELGMDFMETDSVTEPSSPEVEKAVETDLDEICILMERFIVDCGLHDKVDRENIHKTIGDYRIFRKDGKIAAMAKMVPSSGKDLRIVAVYTRDEERGKGYARKVVNTLKNEILESGKVATLNVDRRNPVSSHLYLSLGFRKLFSQGVYRLDTSKI